MNAASNVVPLRKAQLRKRISKAFAEALEEHPPIITDEVKAQMAELDIVIAQIRHGLNRADILEFSEEPKEARMSFVARLVSSGEEFFVRVAIQMVVPYAGMFVVIKRVWR